jgi:hypothetical protein
MRSPGPGGCWYRGHDETQEATLSPSELRCADASLALEHSRHIIDEDIGTSSGKVPGRPSSCQASSC